MDDSVLSMIGSAGGVSVVMIALGRYFIAKTLKQFEKMADDVGDIKTKIAVHEAMREKEKDNSLEIEKLRERLILLDSQLKAAWRKLDDH